MSVYPHVYFAGRWGSRADAVVPVGSLAMRYAVSVFEGIRLYTALDPALPPRPLLLDEHVARLAASLRLMRLPDPGIDRLPDIVDELIARNRIDTDTYVRVSVTPTNPGDLSDDAEPVLAVTAAPMGRKRWLAKGVGMALTVSDWERAGPASFPPAAKNISSYAGPRLAWLAARDAGFDGCVLTNRAGRLSEAPTAALFLVRDGELLTPALDEDVLPSITRAWLLREAGVPARETTLTREDAYRADEAFLCGTGIEIAPVRAFDGHRLRHWPQAPITRRLIMRYFLHARGSAHDGPADLSALVDEVRP
ncbi:aminotransferase class IV [Micromonospora sagamiensis]|uniref:Branched-chain amino acid aminotransferase n=1 Tax=Micromonospora sagamiensis TaxID=47875 RepID=A0A562WGY8_9ACTN|nr:aminotransferase class IV [Micromonospora sagamiensis]TWJ29442.1 branched-chain amino acid aminotransferase [Micromonospora sagamiensis]BCL17529.1 branched-chain amino acid aminotransferase [Micromonospora sagamiensis]